MGVYIILAVWFYNLLPYSYSVFIDAIVESRGDLQGVHDVGERFLREGAAERVIFKSRIVEDDFDVVPSFQACSHSGQRFLPEDQFVGYPGSFRDGAVGTVWFYRMALEFDFR